MRRAVPLARIAGLARAAGLTRPQVEERRGRFGSNEILERARHRFVELAAETAKDPMLWFLLGTSALFGWIGDGVEALVLLLATVPFVGMDAFLHWRTRASTAGLRSRLAARATALRDGRMQDIAAVELVPGDLVSVRAGEPLPADGVVTGGEGLQVDESMLSGEAWPVRKRVLEDIEAAAVDPQVDEVHWGFAGTRLLTGVMALRVTHTGGATLYGEIVRMAALVTRARTPLQRSIARLVLVLVAGAAVFCVGLGCVRILQGHGVVDALLSAATLAVAALPEEFPVVFTFFLGVGVYRLARRRALVRRAVTVENIGRVTCICSDKTGTITEGRLRLAQLVAAPGTAERELLGLAALASRPESHDPLDEVILEEAARQGVGAPMRVATFPFTEDRKRESSAVRRGARLRFATKGSPELIVASSTLGPSDRRAWLERVGELGAQGRKVVALASCEVDAAGWSQEEPSEGWVFGGLVACEDPVRAGVGDAVRECADAGIHTIIVTGDHPATARAVAAQVGLGNGAPRVLDAAAAAERLVLEPALLRDADVIARARPAQKLAFVQALQRQGEIVAVTGDGVNDVPALQAADVGIAMGVRGTQSAREAAAIVLMDDDFSSIAAAIAEGRQLLANLRASFSYLLMIHLPLVGTAALVPLLGQPLLYLPSHIVWLELVIHPTAMLAFQDRPAPARLVRAGRHGAKFFSAREWALIACVGSLAALAVAWGYERSLREANDPEHGRAMALVVLLCTSAFATAALSRLRTMASRVVAVATIASAALFVQVAPIARLLHVRGLHADDWALALGASATAVWLPRWVLARARA